MPAMGVVPEAGGGGAAAGGTSLASAASAGELRGQWQEATEAELWACPPNRQHSWLLQGQTIVHAAFSLAFSPKKDMCTAYDRTFAEGISCPAQ